MLKHPMTFRPPKGHPDLIRRLLNARNMMDNRFDLPLTIECLSDEAYFSPYHFLRQFRKMFNETPHHYLTRRRLEQAKYLLSRSSKSVTEICYEVGFESLGSFSALFQKYSGFPPSSYRIRSYHFFNHISAAPALIIPSCFLTGYNHTLKQSNF